MKGKLIVIDGNDSSGKQTQTAMLYKRLKNEGINIRKVEYPNYNSDSSLFVKMYLNGKLGKDINDVNCYAASILYTVDRLISFKQEWEEFYNSGGIVLADRYTTSNMIHQTVKLSSIDEKEKYLDWLLDLEFNKIKIPKPDQIIFLDMPISFSLQLMENRNNKITNNTEKDIHEQNIDYLKQCYYNGKHISNSYNWDEVCCIKDNIIRSIEEIHEEVYNKIKKVLKVS